MGLVASFQPGGIKTADDMYRALSIVLEDAFSDVGSCEGGHDGERGIGFVLHEPHADTGFRVLVRPYDAVPPLRTSRAERRIIRAIRAGGHDHRAVLSWLASQGEETGRAALAGPAVLARSCEFAEFTRPV